MGVGLCGLGVVLIADGIGKTGCVEERLLAVDSIILFFSIINLGSNGIRLDNKVKDGKLYLSMRSLVEDSCGFIYDHRCVFGASLIGFVRRR